MPEVSISKAIKLAGISRQHFYDAYINTAKISVNRSIPKRPVIDTSEIFRLFGRLSEDRQSKNKETDGSVSIPDESIKLDLERLKAENIGLKSLVEEKSIRLAEKNIELERQRERITSLELRYDRLLEDKSLKNSNISYFQKLKALFS